ncbi:MAG TPA: proteasome subunit beta [Candidatus Nanoarchaeia archaeon]|nr:proteasome subunit beta [Candidatus Nanoarchaeia archaeon]
MDMEKNIMQTGTTTIGIVCKDGIVLAADKRTSAGYLIANKNQLKISKIADYAAITHAGLVSDAQLLTRIIKAQIRLEQMRRNKPLYIKEVANLLGNLLYGNIRRMSMVPGIVGFLLGGKDSKGYYLFDLGIDGSITEFHDYASTGSGSVFSYGVLESSYKEGITIEEGIKLAVKAINASMQRDMASGGGIDIVTITQKGIEKVMDKIIDSRISA